MKKNFLWTMAALFVGGLALTSCDVSDNPNPNPVLPSDPEELFDKTSTVIDFEESTPFINDSRMATVGVDNVDGWESKVAIFKGAGNAQNGYSFAHYDFTASVQQAAISVVSFDMYNNQGSRSIVTIGDALVRTNGVGAGCAKMSYGAKGAIFRIGSDKNNAFINGKTYAQADLCNKWLKVEVKVYNFDRQVQWTVKEGDEIIAQSGVTEGEGEEAIFTPGKEDYWQADANEGTQIDVFGCINNSMNTYIDNLSITNAKDPSIKFVDYKIRYVDAEGKDLKEARIVNGREGTDPVLLATDSAAFYLNEAGEVVASVNDAAKKEIYVSTNVADVKVAENAEVLMTFRDADKYGVVLNCQAGTTILQQTRLEDALFEGDSYSVYPKTGYKHPTDGKYYFTALNGGYNNATYTFGPNDTKRSIGGKQYIIGTLSYNAVDSVAYFSEVEDMELVGTVATWVGWTNMEASTPEVNINLFARFSQGKGPRLTEGSYFAAKEGVAAGTYKVTIYGRSGGSDAQRPVLYYIPAAGGDPVKIEVEVPTLGGAVTGAIIVEGIQLPEGAKIVLKNDGEASTLDIDTISMTKTE